jgi:hypothetical protein
VRRRRNRASQERRVRVEHRDAAGHGREDM